MDTVDDSDTARREVVNLHLHTKFKLPLAEKVNWAMDHYGEADQIEIVSCYTALEQNEYICPCMSELDFYREVHKMAMHGNIGVIIGQHGEFIIKRPQEMIIKRVLWKGCCLVADVSLLCLVALGVVITLPVKLIRQKL